MTIPAGFARRAALEYLEYDAAAFRWALAEAAWLAGRSLWTRNLPQAFRVLSRIHRHGGSDRAINEIETFLARASRSERAGQPTGLWDFYREHVRRSLDDRKSRELATDPGRLLGYRALVTRSPRGGERGVVVLDYSYIFPLFAALFDVEAIAERYHLVLEPSWRGLCTADVLCYSVFAFPVFVQTVEPRDTAFLAAIDANFVTIPTAANWWVDHRRVKPDPGQERDIDVVMVAGWSDVKRHWRFFRVLAALRRAGHRLRVALVGYRQDKTREDVEAEARQFDVLDQIELHESLPIEGVTRLLSRSKVHVLWSRKEGANRAIVEALFADVPVIAREGLGYGYQYPYINEQTGCFATEQTLGETILRVIGARDRFSPRQWALDHMSPQHATRIMDDVIRRTAQARGEPWSGGLAVKTVQLTTQGYWDPADAHRFKDDYAFLRSHIRRPT